MITDVLKNHKQYYCPVADLSAGFDYLAGTDFKKLAAGRYDIKENSVYALVQDYVTKPRAQGIWEAHRRYVDIQFIVSGEEMVGCANIDGMSATADYSDEKDFIPFSGEGSFMIARPGTFFVFFPEDCHMPGIAAGAPVPVRKVVVKVAIEV